MAEYVPVEIEAKWQKSWEESGSFEPDFETEKSRYYMLTMLPYPSGDLHIGHWYAMAPSDTYARFLKMQGNEVFFPIGFDAFGLPAENAAIKNNIHPKDWTYKNIERMRLQLRSMGNMFAWKNEVVSCDPDYYKWSQWFFLRMLEMDLAYREFAPVDFCNHCQTTLAREQVWGDERLCERCGNTVIRKELNQWKLRITNYADELLDFDGLDWPERVRLMQTNWIGRSNGVEFDIELDLPGDLQFRVFTTRPDTVFGMTFCVLAPEHELVEQIVTDDQKEEVSIYCENAMRKDEIERMSESQEKDGVFTGAYAINPLNGDRVPVWVAEYVLAGYGTGAIMGVPAHDQRDFLFARRYDIPTPVVVVPEDHDQPIPEGSELEEALLVKEGSKMVNSNEFDGLVWPEGFDRVVQAIEDKGIGKKQINYRLRDWLISRQRMWGTPIPVIHCKNCGTVPVPYEDLPVMLPDDAEFKPTGESPLKYHPAFLNTECPKCGGSAERETDTMDTFICSSWYYYGYVSPYWKKGEKLKKEDLPWNPEAIQKWCPVNQYTGGIEHATMHLLYFRFFTKVLADMNLFDFREPATRLFNQGMILGEDHEKMSKSRGNVVNPDDLVKKYGADTVRCYLMFLGPWDAGAPWNPHGIEGLSRFFKGIWNLCHQPQKPENIDQESEKKLRKAQHRTLKKVTEDLGRFRFNTAIAALMSFRNDLKDHVHRCREETRTEALKTMLLMLAPLAPHVSEELWQLMAPETGSIHQQAWPAFDEQLASAEMVTLVVQINGKVRDRIQCPVGLEQKQTEEKVLASEKIQNLLEGKAVRKLIVVPDRLVNLVV